MNETQSDTQARDPLGFFVAEFEGQFADALSNKLISPAVREIHNVWVELGRPQEPGAGPHTGVLGHVMTWLDATDIPDTPEDEAEKLAAQYNKAQVQLLELTGVWHAGGDSWHTHWNKAKPEWEEFTEQAWDIATDWLHYRLWDLFWATLPEEA